MSSNPLRLERLFARYVEGSLSENELAEFWQLVSEMDGTDTISGKLEELWEMKDGHFNPAANADKDKILSRILETAKDREIDFSKFHRKRIWPKAAAAAAIVLLAGAGIVYLAGKRSAHPATRPAIANVKNDISPGSNKATLTFGNGSTIMLDSAHIGKLALQAGTDVIKTDSGKLAYALSKTPTEVTYNVLTTPRGGQYQLQLPDGTNVWLNSASSIRYPTAFTGKERVVEITGEAYLEVKHDDNIPFKVKVQGQIIEDVGTSFNVNAYKDEQEIKTTLVEGKVNIVSGNKTNTLNPGEQLQIDQSGKIKLIHDADIEQAIAWKNGIAAFHSVDVTTIMREVSRWYDVDVEIIGNIPARSFYVDISRKATLAELLQVFEVNKIHFTIDTEHRKLTVMP